MRPMEFLLSAYLPECGRNSTGTTRMKVMVRFGGSVGSNVGAGYLSTLTLLQNFLLFNLT